MWGTDHMTCWSKTIPDRGSNKCKGVGGNMSEIAGEQQGG